MHKNENKNKNKVAILDAGAQYGKVIDRKIRELCFESHILPLNASLSVLKEYDAIIISGGPQSVYNKNSLRPHPELFNINKPILGICYGMQLIGQYFDCKITKTTVREDGQMCVVLKQDPLFTNLKLVQQVLLTHGDSVTELSQDIKAIGTSDNAIVAIRHVNRNIVGVQFHPEVDLTINGKYMLRNFLIHVAKLKPTFQLPNRMDNCLLNLKRQIGDKCVIILLSGGIDSTVCFHLLCRVTTNIYGIHIDTGFMRKNESETVMNYFKLFKIPVKLIKLWPHLVDSNISSITNPEEKRKLIGNTIIKITEQTVKELISIQKYFLVQGTLRPDLIESGSHLASPSADIIKTHHNDTELVRILRAKGRIIEPLKDYHKDEVRQIAKMLNLPDYIVKKQPFPGPGLAIRILCKDSTKDMAKENISLSVQQKLKQYNATMLPIKSVGVQGDCRSYSYVALLNEFNRLDRLDMKSLFRQSKIIPKNIHKVNRVVFPLTRVGKIRSLKTFLTHDNIELLQEMDDIVMKHLSLFNHCISQIPVVLLPLSLRNNDKKCIVLRPFITNDFMTGIAAIPGKDIPMQVINELVKKLMGTNKISGVLYDLTSKPPGTTEWE